MTTQEQAHQEPNYMAIFWWLLGLTLAEVGIVYSPISRTALAIVLVTMALWKAALVAMYYMHLKFERRTLVAVVLLPIVLAVGLFVSLLPDVAKVPF